jgi:hypothetical protein
MALQDIRTATIGQALRRQDRIAELNPVFRPGTAVGPVLAGNVPLVRLLTVARSPFGH